MSIAGRLIASQVQVRQFDGALLDDGAFGLLRAVTGAEASDVITRVQALAR